MESAESPTYPQAGFFFLFLFFYFPGNKLLGGSDLDTVTGTNRGSTGTNRGSKGTNRGSKGTNRGDGDLLVCRVPFNVPAWPR
jgi:hypothetical protein